MSSSRTQRSDAGKAEPMAPPSRVKLSTTEPLRSPDSAVTTRKTGPVECPRGRQSIQRIKTCSRSRSLLKHLLVLNSTEHGIYTVHKCKEMLAIKQYI